MDSKENIVKFGEVDGKPVHLISLENSFGTELQVFTLGATWHALKLFDKNKQAIDIVVGPKTLQGHVDQYQYKPYYFGATVGRYAGRISRGRLKIDNQTFQLHQENEVHLHGGPTGLHNKIWEIAHTNFHENPTVTLNCNSPHLEGGYPGNVSISVKYTLTEKNDVKIQYQAITDRTTILNITNHVYLNLGNRSILDHSLQIFADSVLELDKKLIPTGKVIPVEDSSYDFRNTRKLAGLEGIGGLDDCFVLQNVPEPRIKLYDEESGIQLEVMTNQPGVVVFAPPRLDFAKVEKVRKWNRKYPAICLETQFFPDAPNHDHFPSILLKKENTYKNETSFSFSIA